MLCPKRVARFRGTASAASSPVAMTMGTTTTTATIAHTHRTASRGGRPSPYVSAEPVLRFFKTIRGEATADCLRGNRMGTVGTQGPEQH